MKLLKKLKSTRKLINLKSITDKSLLGFNNHHLIYYFITPYNLSVLSNENIEAKIFSLMNLIKGVDQIELICLNSRENFYSNKIFIKSRIEKESNPSIRKLLELDLKNIEEIQYLTATARSFLIILRLKKELDEEARDLINRFEKSFSQFGFTITPLNKDDIKTMLSVYYEQNVTTEKFEDIDGGRWLNNETN